MKLDKTLCYINVSDDLLRFTRINKELINHLSKNFKKFQHKVPMLSLGNAFTLEDLVNFEKKLINFLSLKNICT